METIGRQNEVELTEEEMKKRKEGQDRVLQGQIWGPSDMIWGCMGGVNKEERRCSSVDFHGGHSITVPIQQITQFSYVKKKKLIEVARTYTFE